MAVDAVSLDASASDQSARTRLSDNYDTFLVLLTAQLQNQDPLSPMDSTEFTQQLVQFSQVEQQIRTNEQLESLVAHYQAASAGTALSYLGRDAIIESDTATLAGGQAAWSYNLASTADSVRLEVRDSHNKTLYSQSGDVTAGDHLFTWDGTTTSGDVAPDGPYKLVVTALDDASESVEATINVRDRIIGVDFTGDSPMVLTASERTVMRSRTWVLIWRISASMF